ncbi:hypothetical protein B7P43_G05160, partial [Cryptotermes secundus]
VLGQSAASKMKDIPLSNDTVGRRISDMREDTETQVTEKIKKSKLFALQLDESTDIQNSSILLMYVRYIDHDESDMKEDILSVSKKMAPELNEVLSQSVKIINYMKFFSIRKFVSCPAAKFSSAYMIGRGGPVTWSPRSPDLTPLDYFLWGYVKNSVC